MTSYEEVKRIQFSPENNPASIFSPVNIFCSSPVIGLFRYTLLLCNEVPVINKKVKIYNSIHIINGEVREYHIKYSRKVSVDIH